MKHLWNLFIGMACTKHLPGRILLLTGIVFLYTYGCPIYQIFKISCPCCGVTRAWLAFLQGDIGLAFRYHAFFPVIPMLVLLYMFYDMFPTCWKQYINIVYYMSAVMIFLYALMRWLGVVVMP